MHNVCFSAKPLLLRFITFSLLAVFLTACDGNSIDKSYIPVADAGDDQNTRIGEMITFDASESSDTDDEVLSYRWEFVDKPANSNAVIVDADTVSPTFSADVDGTYVFQLIVNDGKTDSKPDQVIIIVGNVLNAPIASAGDDQTGVVGELIELVGLGSSSDKGELTFSWIIKLRPEGSKSTLSNSDSAEPSFSPDKVGKYIFELRVKRGELESLPDEIIIQITGNGREGNTKPVAVAGQDQRVTIGSEVLLSGSASKDIDNDDLTYSWELIAKPQNSLVSISDTGHVELSFIPDVAGEYVFQLMLNDGMMNSIPDTLKVLAVAVNIPPNKICTPNGTSSKSCNVDNGLGTQIRACAVNGLTWGGYEDCIVTSCNTGYHKEGNSCVIDTPTQVCTPDATESKECVLDNGSGTQTRACAADGSAWSDYEGCKITSCNTGYHKEGNSCVIDTLTQVCTPDATESKECVLDNGSGTQTRACAADGSAWSDYEGCKIASCNTGYHKVGNICVVDVQNNTQPTVNAGSDKTLNEGELVSLLAIASDDGEIVKTEWLDKDGNLLGSELGLALTTLALGDHIFTVKVTDNGGLTAEDDIKVTVQEDTTPLGLLSGKVVDQKGILITNAKVLLATGQITFSNAKGIYKIEGIRPTDRSTVTASRYNFLENSEIIKIKPEKETVQNIVLSRPKKIETFDISKEVTIETDGLIIKPPANGYVDKNGEKVEGKVSLSASYFPITTDEGINEFPGDTLAVNDEGESGDLTSFGFIKIELKDDSGNGIELEDGQEIELSIPADDKLEKPATIPFWYFDEEKGLWVEDGEAVYDPETNTYKTAISTVNRAFNLDQFANARDVFGSQEICVEDKGGNKVLANIIIEPESQVWRDLSRTSTDGLLKLQGIIANNKYNYYASTDDGWIGEFTGNPAYLQSGENTLDTCIVVDESNKVQAISIVGTVVNTSGNSLPDIDISIFGNTEGLTFGPPGLTGIIETKTGSNGQFRVVINKSSMTALEVALLGKEITIKAFNESESYKKFLLDKGGSTFNVGSIVLSSNQPPVANAGLDEVIFLGSPVDLSSNLSYDPDAGDSIAQYEWREGDNIVGLSSSYSSSSLSLGDHYFVLTVTDQFGLKATDEVKVSVVDIQKHRLFVDAGLNMDVLEGDYVNLTLGNTETISVGSSISQVQWKEGNSLISNSANYSTPDLSLGEHTFTLLVKNKHGLEGRDDITVVVHEKSHQLLVNTGLDKTYDIGDKFTISPDIVIRGSAIKSTKWMKASEVISTDYSLTNPNLGVGVHTIQLIVTNENNVEVTDEVIITIKESGSHSLYVNLGLDKFYYSDQIDKYGFSVTTESIQSVGSNPISYVWMLDNKIVYEKVPTYFSETWLPSNIVKELGLNVGAHSFKLIVKNAKGLEESDEVVITIREKEDHYLFADAGLDKSFYVGDSIVIGSSSSTLSIGSSFTSTIWKEGDEVLLASSDTQTYSNTLYGNIALDVGEHTITRIVTNEHGLEASDDVVITIVNKPVVSGDIFADAGLDKVTYQGKYISIGTQNKSFSVNSGLSYKWTVGETVLSYGVWTSSPDLGVGTHSIKLTVTDSKGLTATDTMNLKIVASPEKWVYANAGIDMVIAQGERAFIKASDSKSRYGDLSYKWSENGNTLSTDGYILRYDAMELGSHLIKLTVADDTGTVTDSDEMTLFVVEPKDPPPLHMEIGSNKSIYINDRILLQLVSPSGYIDANRQWIGDGVTLSTDDYFYYEALELGEHTIKVIVTDKDTDNLLGTYEIVITVVEDRPREVNANAGLNQTVYLGNSTILNSFKSYSFGGTIKETQWTENGELLAYGYRSRVGYIAETLGKHTVTLTVTDSNGLTDTDDVIVTVLPKVEEIYADAGKDISIYKGRSINLTINESYSLNNSITEVKWIEDGVTISSNFQSNTLGERHLTLEITDSAGLTASDEVVITVVSDEKLDTVPPILTLIGDSEITITQGDTYIDQGATAKDDRDGVITENIISTNRLFTTYVLGKYQYNYRVSDIAGNSATATRTITIVAGTGDDDIPPVITLIGENPMNIIQGTEYNDAGITVLDSRDGTLAYTFNSNVNINIPSAYQVVYTAKDAAGNSSKATRVVNVLRDPNIVIDTTKPVITLKGESVMSITEGVAYTDEGATATDNIDGDITEKISIDNPVDINIVKDYNITYSVKDKAGNEATLTRTVKVTKKPDEPDTLPPILVKSLEWLETQKQADGAYTSNAKISMAWQSTAEVLRAYHKVGDVTATGIAPAKAYLSAEDSKKIEALARKIIMGSETGDDVSAIVSELIQLQNIDSGFGDQAHYHSRVTDTAFALKALGMVGNVDTKITGFAINYLKRQQSAGGGFSHSSKNNDSIYETALTLIALQEFQHIYSLESEIRLATTYLLDNQSNNDTTNWEAAYALLAIKPTTANKVAYKAATDRLKVAQLSNGSWSNEVYTTALAIRAIYKAENALKNL